MFFFFLVSFGIFVFLFYNVHYLMLLLSLELILLSVVFFVVFCWSSGMVLVKVFFFLLLMACMGGFSISLLVLLFRSVGKDFWFGSQFF